MAINGEIQDIMNYVRMDWLIIKTKVRFLQALMTADFYYFVGDLVFLLLEIFFLHYLAF
jgi:hypothetical protein